MAAPATIRTASHAAADAEVFGARGDMIRLRELGLVGGSVFAISYGVERGVLQEG